MKVNHTDSQNSASPILMKMRKVFSKTNLQLKQLVRDVFEKKTITAQKVEKKIDEHNLPSFIWAEGDYKGTKVINLAFYPEDIEKMKKMSAQERIEYKAYLMHHKRYIDSDVIGSL